MKNLKKDKYFELAVYKIPIYGGKFIVIHSNDKKSITKYIPHFKYKGDDIYGTMWPGSYKGKGAVYVIFNTENKYKRMNYGVIAHEAIHFAFYTLDYRGIILTVENDEPLAYLSEWGVNKIHKAFNKFGIMHKIK